MPASRKIICDLPQFSVSAAKYWEDEHATVDLTGLFDKLEGVREGMCWLLLSDKQSYYGGLSSLNSEMQTAEFQTHDTSPPIFEGKTFYYLSAYWQAYHVWMVTDVNLSWQELIFESSDAVSEGIKGSDGQNLTRLRKASHEDVSNPELNIAQNGWDHEHCELCNAHIDPGDRCYLGDDSYWVCQFCYPKYVQPHDLSFIDGI